MHATPEDVSFYKLRLRRIYFPTYL